MAKKQHNNLIKWENFVPTEYFIKPAYSPVETKGPRGRMTRHVSFLGSRKLVPMDHFSSRKEHYQPNHVYLEHVPSFPAQTATFGYPVILRKPGVTRSKSFAAMTTRSSHSAMVPHVSPPVLGDTLKSRTWNKYHTPPKPGHYVLVGNKKSLKIPKIPRPVRTFQMFDCVRKGVREFIDVTRDDIDQLHSRGLEQAASSAQLHGASRRTSHIAKTFWEENLKQGKLLETDKQLKSAERYLKKLEFHLSKVEELHDCYLIQHQLREGTKTMHRAYITSPGNKKNILSNVRYGMKECTQTMCLIEAQLEAMMGTFNCRLKGMAGFARLCSGDVFEVSLKHGNQKWKSRGRIEKTGNQRWDNAEYTMKAQIGDVLHIKGVEVRSFKSVILGQKSCDTRELFSSNPQLMTVSINANGSLKLSIIITWNPLDGVEDNLSVYEMPTRQQSPPKRRPVSVLALNGELTGSYMSLSEEERRLSSPHSLSQSRDDNFILKTSFPPSISANSSPNPSKSDARLGHRDSGFSSAINLPNSSPPVTHNKPMAPRPPSPEEGHKLKRSTPPMLRQQAQSTPALRNSSPVLAHSTLPPSILEYLHFPVTSQGSHDHKEPMTVEDALNILTTSLEDFHGQFRELEKLEDIVVLLEQILRKESRRSSHSSSISISIENALEAFDFLDTEENPEHDANKTDKHGDTNLLDTVLSSPESTAKTADSGIESLAKRLSEDTQLGSSSGSSPVPPTTGNDEVDQALIFHLLYCELLLGSLGVFGPLKCKEIYALDKLQKQADIIEKLIKIARKGSEVDLQAEMAELTEDKAVREFWVQCTDQSLLHVRPEKLVAALENKYGSQLQIKYNKDPKKMLRHLVARILDIANYEAEVNKPFCVVTLHQFMLYCKEQGGLSCVGELATQLNLIDKLCSPVSETVIRAILTLRDDLPAPCVLKVMGALLLTKAQDVYRCLASYLNLIRMKDKERDKAVVIFVEGLEDKTMEVRAGACVALSILKATESIQQMSYVCQSDTVNDVKIKAKEALLSLGAEGRKAYEEAQLSSHGFQGVQFRK